MRTSCPLVKTRNICPICGADKNIWREVFSEEHHCPENGKQVVEPKGEKNHRESETSPSVVKI